MCLIFLAARRRPNISRLYQNRLSNDEFRILNAIRLLAENKAEGAAYQIGDLVRGPLNFSIIRVCADIIRILQSKQLGLAAGSFDGRWVMKRINYTSRAKVMRSIVWISGCTIFFVCYAFSWTLVI